MTDEKKLPRIEEESEFTITLLEANNRRTTFYRSRRTFMPLIINEIKITATTSLFDQYTKVTETLPPFLTQISGIGTIEVYAGISIMGSSSGTAKHIPISLIVPSPAQLKSHAEWANPNHRPTPTETVATLQYRGKDEHGPELWEIECWLSEDRMNSLVNWLQSGEVMSLRLGITSDDLFLDDIYDESNDYTNWILKPIKFEEAGAYSVGQIGYVSATKQLRTLIEGQDQLANDKKESDLETFTRLMAEIHSSQTTISNLYATRFDDFAIGLKRIVKWQIILIATALALVVLLVLR